MPNYRPEPDRFFEKIEHAPNGCWMWIGGISQGTGYGTFKLSRKRQHIGAHRWSYQHHKGPIPAGMTIDHTCHNRACVNPDHLRLASSRQNGENRGVLNPNNTTGHRGVYYCKRTKRFGAQITVNRKTMFLGRFPTASEAAGVARQARLLHFTHNILDRA